MSLTRDELLHKVDELYQYRDLYIEEHSVDKADQKEADVEKKMLETLQLIDENKTSLKSKAEHLMLSGKCLNVKSKFDENAQELVSKAVKLDPKHVESWNILGECFWKKGDIESAKNCFTGALQHSKNKVSLRNLSMVLRQFGSSPEDKLHHIHDSVTHAKEAINLDISDGTSWFVLGNAYLALFFSGSQNEQSIQNCMKAYSQAEKDLIAKNNPDLHFNRSMCYMYQGDFVSAFSGFKKSAELDPSWDMPKAKADMLKTYLKALTNMLTTKCGLVGKTKLQKLKSSIDSSGLGPYSGGSYTSPVGHSINLEYKCFGALSSGLNTGVVVCGKVIGSRSSDSAMPYTFILVDADEQCIAVCLYNVAQTYGVNSGDCVAIPEPYLMSIKFEEEDSDSDAIIQYEFIRVETPMVLAVNGKKLGIGKQAPTVLSVTALSD
ncbi:TTC5 [Bugula neritina]|uniref:TTC5 n=1 Tax=Bugula neritina TaxID=10212 RepID=A0A7J7K3A5_BUGNE|nr:TTC5 [Bugula neritina]